jgi:hypothetical protein
MKTMQKILSALGLIFVGVLLSQSVRSESVPDLTLLNNDPKPVIARTKAVEVPENIDFAGEIVPVKDVDVYERLDRELLINTYLHSSTILNFKRANKFFPVIEPILKEYGVPDDFKYLAVIESNLQNVTSSAGAKGIWQFMPLTAKQYHLEKSTIAACKYLIDAKSKFGSWTLAAASYNAGMGGIDSKLTKQDVADYYNLLLNSETSRYLFRIIAVKQIMQNPEKYGFDFQPEDFYQYTPNHKIEIDSSITDLTKFAAEQGINYKILKRHNPWLLGNALLNNSHKKYEIEIPDDGFYVLN